MPSHWKSQSHLLSSAQWRLDDLDDFVVCLFLISAHLEGQCRAFISNRRVNVHKRRSTVLSISELDNQEVKETLMEQEEDNSINYEEDFFVACSACACSVPRFWGPSIQDIQVCQ